MDCALDDIAAHLMLGTTPDDRVLRLVCAHVACIFEAYIATSKGVHVYLVAGEKGRILPFLHVNWSRWEGHWIGGSPEKTIESAVFSEDVDMFDVGKIDGQNFELWVAPRHMVLVQCSTCGSRYGSSVNAARCGAAHPLGVLKGRAPKPEPVPGRDELIAKYWDDASEEARGSVVGPLQKGARFMLVDMDSESFPDECVPFLMALCGDDISGEELVRGLNAASEGTHGFLLLGDEPIEKPILIKDRLAVLAHVFGRKIVDAHASKLVDELLEEEKLKAEREMARADKALKAKKRREKRAKRLAEEERAKRLAEEERAKRLAEEKRAKRLAEEEKKRIAFEEEKAKMILEEELMRIVLEEEEPEWVPVRRSARCTRVR